MLCTRLVIKSASPAKCRAREVGCCSVGDDARVADGTFGVAEAEAGVRIDRAKHRDHRAAHAGDVFAETEAGGLQRREHEVFRRRERHLHQRQAAEEPGRAVRLADELRCRRHADRVGQHRVDGAFRPRRRDRGRIGKDHVAEANRVRFDERHVDQPATLDGRQGRKFRCAGGTKGGKHDGRRKRGKNAILFHLILSDFGATAPLAI